LVGPEYSAEAAKLLPPTGIAIFLFASRVHYFYYSMHLTGRTWTMLQASVPAALLNLVLNVILLPRFGLIGAVWASVAAYAVGLLIGVYLSIRYFPLPFPAWAAVKAAIATAAMCGLLASLRFPMNALGLAEMVLLGVTLYGTLVFAFDIGRIRSKISGILRAREERVQLSG
jgi:O-antigen/teichoic acid export membrane protein